MMADLLDALPKSIKRTVMLLALGGGLVFGGDAWVRHVAAATSDEKLAPLKIDLARELARISQSLDDLRDEMKHHR